MAFLLTHSNRKKGQTLVIALIVMFLLAVVAALFIALVARNLFRSERYSKTDAVAQIAEAGIKYADQMLTTSEEGADWRPAPDNVGSIPSTGNPLTANGPTPDYPTPDMGKTYGSIMPNWMYLRNNHPDFKWVRPYWPTEIVAGSTGTGLPITAAPPGVLGYAGPTGGYTTFHTGDGRYLLRVSYNPSPNDALSKYIRIDSIGRWGEVEQDPNYPTHFDPTTLKPHTDSLLRREITAFKPIGLTDYCRFITNKDHRSMDMSLGAPGFTFSYGRAASTTSGKQQLGARGGPIRVNGNLMWYAQPTNNTNTNPGVQLFLRGIYGADNTGSATGAILPVDRVEVAGDINTDTDVHVILNAVVSGGTTPTTLSPQQVFSSNDPNNPFTTANGFYRDGSDNTDASRISRGVKRIEPPLVDGPDPTNTTTRYRLLTLNSGARVWKQTSKQWINMGAYGWGRGVYIDNLSDRQDESETLIGGYTLRSDWMQPNNPMSSHWKGPYYCPPGVVITLSPDDYEIVKDNGVDRHQYYFTMTRSDIDTNTGQKMIWYDATGLPRPDWGQTIRMPYPDPNNGRFLTSEVGITGTQHYLDGNGVIYAEGNIRIRGMLPPGMQLTVVSGKTIYIEGNLLKNRTKVSTDDPSGTADKTCGLALLAHDYICVNTTQFFASDPDIWGSDAENGQAPYHVTVNNEADSRYMCNFEFGPWESALGTAPTSWDLFLRHSGEYGPTYINSWIFQQGLATNWLPLNLNTLFTGLPKYVWGVGDPNFNNPGWGVGSAFAGDVFDFATILNVASGGFALDTMPGHPTKIQIGLDQTTYTQRNYWMGGFAVQPFDIRIEAVLYAQEGSFFVIPGNWFNPNQSDARPDVPGEDANQAIAQRTGAASKRPAGVRNAFPFYGDGLDVRIIIDGAVSENIPAATGDVAEWMTKWGSIPPSYGSTNTPTGHPGEGLTFLYDDCVGWPVVTVGGTTTPIRYDSYGRALPIAPRLPVSGSLIYFGDVM